LLPLKEKEWEAPLKNVEGQKAADKSEAILKQQMDAQNLVRV